MLKSAYIAEVLGLQYKSESLYQFDTALATEKLKNSFVVKEASIKKMKPGTLFVSYSLRQPIGYVADFTNTLIDAEGMLFPSAPFYSPKNLPEIYLGEPRTTVWGEKTQPQKMVILKEMLTLFSFSFLDLSGIDAPTLGQREIVLEVSHKGVKHFLRLTPGRYKEELRKYFRMRELKQLTKSCTLDLRLPDVALISDS